MMVTIEVRAQPGKVNELYQTLQALLPTMRKEKGCQACRVTRDVEDGELFFLSSEWDVPGSFEGYVTVRERQRPVRGHRLAGRVGEIQDRQR